MKTVILSGGYGSRLGEETHLKPKPMIEIGEKPILWHIMKIYSHFNFHDFIICLGYKGYVIKEYFANYFLHECDVTFDFKNHESKMTVNENYSDPWRVALVNTGLDTMTGGRIKRIQKYISDETFMMTYGDGVADINIKDLLNFHRSHGKIATVTTACPPGRFGALEINNNRVVQFNEKPRDSWVNAGFFVFETRVFDYIENDQTLFEKEPLENLARDGELMAYKHQGLWHPMDTYRDKLLLEGLWQTDNAAWKIW